MINRLLLGKNQTPILYRGLVLVILICAVYDLAETAGKFGDFFVPAGKVTIHDTKLNFLALWAAEVGPTGRISVIDMPYEGFVGLKIFSADGRFLHEADKLKLFDREILIDHAEGNKGRIIANSMARLLFFDEKGGLQNVANIANTETGLLERSWTTGVVRVDLSPTGEIVGAGIGYPKPNFLHTFDKNGKLLREFLLLDKKYNEPYIDMTFLDVDSMGDIWCTFPVFYKVFHYGVDGTQKKEIIGQSPLFTPPDRLKFSGSGKKWYKWLKTWTPTVGCAATQSGYVLLVMLAGEKGKPFVKSYDPEGKYDGGFFVDIYDREGNMIAAGLHTPHRFLCVDDKDNLWFALAPGTLENPKDGPVVLGKYRLNLKSFTTPKAAAQSKPTKK
ncbi:MAG TPA: hypothetical protein VNL73_10335 [Verrucomicrobiae bacterium]|nr:hypothetical protein [Verrucomicrobiae bacterium]